MLSSYTILRLIWVCGFFTLTALLSDVTQTVAPLAAVSMLLIPLVVTISGEVLEDSATDSRQKLGTIFQIVGSGIYISYIIIAAYFYAQNQTLSSLVMLVVSMLGGLAAVIVIADCGLALTDKDRISRSNAPIVNLTTVVILSALFTGAGFYVWLREPDKQELMTDSVLMFFSAGFAILAHAFWLHRQLNSKPALKKPQKVRALDLIATIWGVAGLGLVCRAVVTTGADRNYALAIGICLAFLGVINTIMRVKQLQGALSSFVASQEGLIELHKTGWILYRWHEISLASLMTSANMPVISIMLAIPDQELHRSEPPHDKSLLPSYEEWYQRRKRQQKHYSKDYGVDLAIGISQCREDIVSLWHSIQLAKAEPSQAQLLRPGSDFGLPG